MPVIMFIHVDDLMNLDMSSLYQESEVPQHGKLPFLAYQRLGDNMAASFCERMNSIAKGVLTEGRTMLNNAELPVLAWVCAVTEKLSHSTVPWAGKGERRTAFYKFVPYVRRPRPLCPLCHRPLPLEHKQPLRSLHNMSDAEPGGPTVTQLLWV